MKTAVKTPQSTHTADVVCLQRKCACGQHRIPGNEECNDCHKRRLNLKRRKGHFPEAQIAPPIVSEVLRSTGSPLAKATRKTMEGFLGHSFAHVRVHTDSKAAASAQTVNALAYTVGQNIVFGTGQYAPKTATGKGLLAHELTHVVQQRPHTSLSTIGGEIPITSNHDASEREARSNEVGAAGKSRILHHISEPHLQRVSFWESVRRFFGGGTFSDEELLDYLNFLDVNDQIEDDLDSDNKAREVVQRWKEGDTRFYLPIRRKELLIREMLTGFTGNDDENAILELLSGSNITEITIIFNNVGLSWLNRAFQGDQQDELDRIVVGWRRATSSESGRNAAGGAARPANDVIDRIVINQAITQTVTVHWQSGQTESDICSTGKGHCCVDENAGEGTACSEAESRQNGSNCTPVGTHTVAKKIPRTAGNVELWTEFVDNRDIALHEYEPRIDGTPLSHGCVRLRRPMAQKVYDGSVENHTEVEVRGLARPRCSWPALQAEWAGDFRTAGTVPDGEPPRRQRSINRQRATLREIFDIDNDQLDTQIERLEQELGGSIPYASSIWGGRRQRIRTLSTLRPLAAEIPRCVPTQTIEEQRLSQPEPTAVLLAAQFDRFVVPFQQALNRIRSYQQARRLSQRHGQALWQAALTQAQANPNVAQADDRPLYWARLQMMLALRNWTPRWLGRRVRGSRVTPDDIRRQRSQLLTLFEQASRGMDTASFTQGQEFKRILISGFDPFGLSTSILRGNPSGAAVLALDNTIIQSGSIRAEIQGVIFPVRFADFDAGFVETFFQPYFTGPARPDMIMTVSMGGSMAFEVEEYAGRRRSSGSFRDNAGQTAGGSRSRPIEPPGLGAGPEFLRTALPSNVIRQTLGRRSPLPAETEVTEIPRGGTQPVERTSGPTSGATAVRGSGGGFLSNEIFYRTRLLRDSTGAVIPVGHLHTPLLRSPQEGISSQEFVNERTHIIQQIRQILEATLSRL